MLPQQHVKDSGLSAKRTGGRSQLKTDAPYICGFARSDVAWYMIAWCTQNAPRRHQFYVVPDIIITTKQLCKYTTSADIQNAL